MSTEVCSGRVKIAIKIINFLAGIAIGALGVYRFTSVKIAGPRDLFLSLYYILFGGLLIICECPYEKIIAWFKFIANPFGKSLFLLFLAAITLDISAPVYLIISVFMIVCAILQIVYML